jgi:hypothetical protein
MNQAAALQSQIQSIQEHMAAAEKARQGDRAYLQVGNLMGLTSKYLQACCISKHMSCSHYAYR